MQLQADVLGVPVERPGMLEVTAFGRPPRSRASPVGFWKRPLASSSRSPRTARRASRPRSIRGARDALYAGWKRAVERSRRLGDRMTKPLVIAHRGASAHRPENTMPAFELAIEQRADMIETDLHRTRDGAVVVTHDEELAGSAVAARSRTRRSPRARARRRRRRARADARRAARRLRRAHPVQSRAEEGHAAEYDGLEAIAIEAVRSRGIARAGRSSRPSMTRCWRGSGRSRRGAHRAPDLAEVPGRRRSRAHGARRRGDPSGAALVDAALVDAAHDAGLAVYVFTVDDAAEMRRLLDLGVDGLFTNHPDRMRALVDGAGGA
jgi:glycerophosphoryl diester phosphodiesterase